MEQGSHKKPLRLVITGASGFVAQQVIPYLEQESQLILVGRDEKTLADKYPNHITCSYNKMGELAQGADALLHLAVSNNNLTATLEEARAVNVDFLKDIVEAAKKAGIGRFIYTSTTHAMKPNSNSPYVTTKREAEEWLSGIGELPIFILSLPAVYGNRYAGRLSVLNQLPTVFRPFFMKLLSTLVPAVSAKTAANAIVAACKGQSDVRLTVTDRQADNWIFAVLKRTTDLGFALSILVFFWWLLLAVWIAVKVSTPGPGLFAQKRVGFNRQEFVCLKFRTMHTGTSQAGTHDVNASAVTPIGRFLRKTKLDELPQVWNILKNELSLVGPRPCLPIQQHLIDERAKADVFSIKPGITGLAQVRGIDMRDPVKLAMWDKRYLDQQSLLLDIKIIFQTAVGRGQGDKVGED